MANRLEISDEEWTAIYPILAACKQVRIASEAACRAFLAAVLWVLRLGAQGRPLPAEHGQWNSVFKRFSKLVPPRRLADIAHDLFAST